MDRVGGQTEDRVGGMHWHVAVLRLSCPGHSLVLALLVCCTLDNINQFSVYGSKSTKYNQMKNQSAPTRTARRSNTLVSSRSLLDVLQDSYLVKFYNRGDGVISPHYPRSQNAARSSQLRPRRARRHVPRRQVVSDSYDNHEVRAGSEWFERMIYSEPHIRRRLVKN